MLELKLHAVVRFIHTARVYIKYKLVYLLTQVHVYINGETITERERERERERQTDRETDRETARQNERQRELMCVCVCVCVCNMCIMRVCV